MNLKLKYRNFLKWYTDFMAIYHLTDDSKETLGSLLKERLPWLAVGLLGGILATIIVSYFKDTLSKNLPLAFFLPVIVYMSDAIGTQTETIYVRNLAKFKDNFFKYLFKEILVGLTFGIIFGLLITLFAKWWFNSDEIALSVGLAMFINATIAPVVSLIIPEILFKEHTDPALGSGPFTTVIQDIISLSIYLLIATVIIF